jgi:hypothetical protein
MAIVAVSASSIAVVTGRAVVTAIPANLVTLVALWQTLDPSLTTADKLRAVNAIMVPGNPVDVPRAEINKVLDGDLAALQAYIANPPQGGPLSTLIAANYLVALVTYEASYSPTLRTSSPLYFATIQGMVPDLLAAGVTQATIANLVALIRPLTPWWQANGFSGPVNIWDLISAGNLY